MQINAIQSIPITVNPEIMSGTPVFQGTRVPVQTLFDYLMDYVKRNKISMANEK